MLFVIARYYLISGHLSKAPRLWGFLALLQVLVYVTPISNELSCRDRTQRMPALVQGRSDLKATKCYAVAPASSARSRSACRRAPVFANRRFRWVRAVLTETRRLAAAS